MAQHVSSNYRKTIYSGGAEHNALLTIGDNTIDVSNIKKITIKDDIIDASQDVFRIGTFISKQVDIVFKNADEIDLDGKVHLEIATKVDGYWEWVVIGDFNIETSPTDYYKNAKLTMLDDSILFKPSVDIHQWFDKDKDTITVEELLKALCNHFLGEDRLGTYPNVNLDKVIGFYDSTVSGKQYISWLAELMGSNAKIGRDGKLYLIPLKRGLQYDSDTYMREVEGGNTLELENTTDGTTHCIILQESLQTNTKACYLTQEQTYNITLDAPASESYEVGDRFQVSSVRFDNGIIADEYGCNGYYKEKAGSNVLVLDDIMGGTIYKII